MIRKLAFSLALILTFEFSGTERTGVIHLENYFSRRIKNNLIKDEEIINILKPKIAQVKAVILDYHGAMVKDLEEDYPSLEVYRELNSTLARLPAFVVTDARLSLLEEHFLSHMPVDFTHWENLFLYPWAGGAGYGIDAQGRVKKESPFYYEPFVEGLEDKIKETIALFSQRFGGEEIKDVLPKDGFRITLHLRSDTLRSSELYEEYLNFFREKLSLYINRGELFITPSRKQGAIHFSSSNKLRALRDILERLKIGKENVIIIGDSPEDFVMHTSGMLTFNVGGDGKYS
ncbi:MAG: HAD hydrolase family protein [Candidatus Omnitrophica bacterium]|nr:HAD hydrolase family protein [Candidatus Omnitrophota bacterium]